MPVDNPFGARLKALRGSRSLAEIATAVGVTPKAILNYEHGRIPRGDILEKMAVVLGVSSRYLLTGSDKKMDIVADPFEEWPEPKDPRRRLVREIKKFALEADPEQDTKLINALLENVEAFREVLKRRRQIKGGEP